MNLRTSVFIIFAFGMITTVAFSQPEMNSKGEPVVKSAENAPVNLKKGETIFRGARLSRGIRKMTVAAALAAPEKVAGQTVELSGVIVRSCRKEGCWMEMADRPGGPSVRVTFGNHAFFIPVNSAGMKVRTQGVFKVNVLSKEKVEHLIKEDGAKFDRINPDGTVTEISFEALGVELTKIK